MTFNYITGQGEGFLFIRNSTYISSTYVAILATTMHKSSKNQHVPLIMCCANSNDKIIDFLYTKIKKIDEK